MDALKRSARSLGALSAAVLAATALAAPGEAAPDESRVAPRPAPTRAIDHPTGATESRTQGSVPGGMTTTPGPEKEERANTPPGKDRDGHGPAAGAILDPSGVTTERKPF
jgi:hypothetical protein